MRIDISEEGMTRISEIYEPIIIKAEKDSFVISQRDGHLELFKKPASLYNISIIELHSRGEISARLRNSLLSGGVMTFQDLRRADTRRLLKIKGFGRKSQNEVKQLLLSKTKT